jgi:hypothetical protein
MRSWHCLHDLLLDDGKGAARLMEALMMLPDFAQLGRSALAPMSDIG